MTHLIPLGDTGWSVWRDVLLRSAGFPADGLDRFEAGECAAIADQYLAGTTSVDAFQTAFAQAILESAKQVCQVAAEPRFREAVVWQNPEVVVALDGLVTGGPGATRNVRRRGRENVVAGYWQRYLAKSETIGFFGPACWGTVLPGEVGVVTRPGPELIRSRATYLEYWALMAFAERLAADRRVRPWLAPVIGAQVSLDGRVARIPAQRPVELSRTEALALGGCDGKASAHEVVARLIADDSSGVRRAEEGFLALERLVERGLLRWDFDLPQGFGAEQSLRRRLESIADETVRQRALTDLDRLTRARELVAAAAGDPQALGPALSNLDSEFTDLTGLPPRRRAGQTYAGRAICHEETARDVEFTVGGALLDELAPALALPLQAARWLTYVLAGVYAKSLRELYEDLRLDGVVRLGDLWFLAQGLLFGAGARPVDPVAQDFAQRWADVFGLSQVPVGTKRLDFSAASLAPLVAAAFPAVRPGWSTGRIHSPDLQLCADSPQALARGEFLAVLGELHAAYATFNAELFTHAHPDVASLRAALAVDLGPGRLRPVYPINYPRTGGRLMPSLFGPPEHRFAFADAPGVERAGLVAANSAIVDEADGQLVVNGPDGDRWPLLEAFTEPISTHTADAFKLMTDRPHSPRVTVDRLVLARETWRTTVAQTGLVEAAGEEQRYLAVRRWRERLGLPERVFVRVPTETKPAYVDLTSPLYGARLCLMLRAAKAAAGAQVPVVVSELLPTAEQAWLPDAAGRRYVSELRMQICDMARAEEIPG